jgi:oxaloacetate decarboxylase gamma subunit
MENLNTALGLLVVGMVTVFIVLWLVVLIGNLVIRVTNRVVPFEDKPDGGSRGRSDTKKMAAIVAAVDAATGGRGSVDSIQKLH